MPFWSTRLVFRFHQCSLSFKSQSFTSSQGSVRKKEQAFPDSLPLAFTIGGYISSEKSFPLTPIPLCYESGDLLCHAISVRIASFQEAPLETWLEFSLNLWPIIAKSPFPPCSSFRQIRGPFGQVITILFKPVRQSFVKSPFSQNLSHWPILEVACDQFESCLQFTCGSPSTKLSDFRLSAGSGNDRECKQALKTPTQRVMTSLWMSYAPISISRRLFRCRH